MSKNQNTNFTIHAPAPIDSRTQVSTYAGLALIPVVFIGLKVYVVNEDKEYRYKSTGWTVIPSGSSTGNSSWGSIDGDIDSQTDLVTKFLLKFDKAGGTITGETTVLADVYARNFIVWGSTPSTEFPYTKSTVDGEPVGSSVVLNTVFISQTDYDAAVIAGTLVTGTNYIKT